MSKIHVDVKAISLTPAQRCHMLALDGRGNRPRGRVLPGVVAWAVAAGAFWYWVLG